MSLQYRPSPIPTGGLEIPLMLQFSCSRPSTFYKMKTFVRTLYKYDFEGEVVEEEEEEEIVIPVGIDNDEENTQDDDHVEV